MTLAAPHPASAAEQQPDASSGAVVVRPPSAWWVLIAGVIGLAAAFALTIDKIKLLENPSFVPPCNINPILSCGSVMATPRASLFGFPNPMIGIVAFSVVVVSGVLAVGRVTLPRWYWIGLAAGSLVGAAFVHWLIYQSIYRIGALCPYCMVVWAVTIPLFVVAASIALQPAPASERYPQRTNVVARGLYQWRWPLVTLWFVALILLILVHFWYYWSTLI